ncbi:hypothetical protein [Thermaerobacter litoralis]
MRVQLTPAAAAYAARELARRPELNHTLTVEAFLVAGCCSPSLPPEVRLGPPPSGDFRAVTVPLGDRAVRDEPANPEGRGTAPGGPGAASGDGAAPASPGMAASGMAAPAGEAGAAAPPVPAVEVYVDPLVDDFVRDWYGEDGQEAARRAVLCIDLARYAGREELTVRPWPPQPPQPAGAEDGGAG